MASHATLLKGPRSRANQVGTRPTLATSLFDEWTGKRSIRSIGTNNGAPVLAFQSWHRFKEAFPPEFVRNAIQAGHGEVQTCLDPFGGSGTTALAAQFLGISSTTVEVNPFLVDVIEAKLARYDPDELARDFIEVRRQAADRQVDPSEFFEHTPQTFVEPGVSDRWIFGRDVAMRLGSILAAIETLQDNTHRRLFRILVAGLLIDVSNVMLSGKGRRYRRNWEARQSSAAAVDSLFQQRAQTAITDIYRFASRPSVQSKVIHGDARRSKFRALHDIAVFSPPYPNSFDYTDVYNVELWMLGYLTNSADNKSLRGSTMTSHVQLHRDYPDAPDGSRTLRSTLRRLNDVRGALWSQWIPDMVGGYFADLLVVLNQVQESLREEGTSWLVVGDSRYGGVYVPTGRILKELALGTGWDILSASPFRAMRSSPQHGGDAELPETLLCLRKPAA
jgi:hypothetical protein